MHYIVRHTATLLLLVSYTYYTASVTSHALSYNAGDINEGSSYSPDSFLNITGGNGSVGVTAWQFDTGYDLTKTFSVPQIFTSSPTPTVTVYFATGSGTSSGTVNVRLSTLFATQSSPFSGLVNTYNNTITVSSTGTSGTYNYYSTTFTLSSDTIAAGDLAVLNLTRTIGDTYTDPIYVTSIEFDYDSP